MVLSRKRVQCPLRVGNEILSRVEEFKYLGVLFTSERQMEQEIDSWIGVASAVMRALHRPIVVKKELRVKLRSYPHLWSRAVGSDRKNEIVDTSGRNGLPTQGVWALPQRWGEKFGHPGGARSRATAPPHQEEPDEVARACG